MSGCHCNSASIEPCRYCQDRESRCHLCGEVFDSYACKCPFCEACGEVADHDTDHHYYEAGSLYCFEQWGCEEKYDHYHPSQEMVDKMKEAGNGI